MKQNRERKSIQATYNEEMEKRISEVIKKTRGIIANSYLSKKYLAILLNIDTGRVCRILRSECLFSEEELTIFENLDQKAVSVLQLRYLNKKFDMDPELISNILNIKLEKIFNLMYDKNDFDIDIDDSRNIGKLFNAKTHSRRGRKSVMADLSENYNYSSSSPKQRELARKVGCLLDVLGSKNFAQEVIGLDYQTLSSILYKPDYLVSDESILLIEKAYNRIFNVT